MRHTGQLISERRAKMLNHLATKGASVRRKETQEKLLAAGRELITQKGIGATSVGDICKEAGFTRGAFYSNFTDMPHFLEEVTRDLWRCIVETLLTQIGEDQDAFLYDVDELNSLLTEKLNQWIEQKPEKQLTLGQIAGQLVRSLPDDRDCYLLMQELRGFALRSPEPAKPVREMLLNIANAVEAIIDSVLKANNAHSIISTRHLRTLLINWRYSQIFDAAMFDETADTEALSIVAEELIKLND